MKLFAPKYYKKFQCIADRCRHSCCVGWEIDIDNETVKKYAALTDGYGEAVKSSIEMKETPHFRLCKDERCPHLDKSGLCRIITELGESYLCHICREHPRFYNETSEGPEVGLGLSCEEACRIVLSSDGYDETEVIGEKEWEVTTAECGFDPLPIRKKLYSVLSDSSVPYSERLLTIYREYGVSPDILTDMQWKELLSSLEYLDPAHRKLFSAFTLEPSTPGEIEKSLERFLAYLIYRHVTAAESEGELSAALGFSLFCERLLCSVAKAERDLPITFLARVISEELEYSEDNTDAVKFEFWF